MKWFIGGIFVVGAGLIWLGNNALNEPNQSADVRAGGIIPIAIGCGMIVLDVLVALIWLIVRT